MLRNLRTLKAQTKRTISINQRLKSEEVEVFVNGQSVKVPKGSALIQACEKAGAYIPRFCYHERLAVAGNCRMCLVEVEKSAKPVVSCAFPIMPGMKVYTDSPLVKKAREGVMEFLLANHPLDCPICDQGGECDLQDQSVRYGSDRSRFFEPEGKRAVENKNFGPLVKTIMTRCIQCTRCVRFANEIAGAPELGTSGRGNDMQIGMYIDKVLNTELSGNVIDLCPVGALTSKPYSFTTRPWELKKVESIDVMDAVGSNIRVDSRGLTVMRILPRLNEEINEEWINDKTRFAYDGLKTQRLTMPLMKQQGRFVPVDWPTALNLVSQKMNQVKPEEIKAIAGQLADAESMVVLKDLLNKVGSENLNYEGRNQVPMGVDFRTNYTFNSTISGISEADAILIIGSNPRLEATMVNLRIRKAYLQNDVAIGLIGNKHELTYEYDYLGEDIKELNSIIKGKGEFAKKFKQAKKPMIIIGTSVMDHEKSKQIFSLIATFVDKFKSSLFQQDYNGYNILHKDAARVAALDIGFVPNTTQDNPKFVYLLGADNVENIPKEAFVVYQGHTGDNGAQLADLILPSYAYTEKNATYVNLEGRTQITRAAVSAPGASREDWKIIKAISEVSGHYLAYEEIGELKERMYQISPTLLSYDNIEHTTINPLVGLSMLKNKNITSATFNDCIDDFYLTNPIARASQTMAKCSKVFVKKEKEQVQEECA